MMARMTPVSLHFSDVPTGWKKIFTDKQQLATGFACSSRTVSPDTFTHRRNAFTHRRFYTQTLLHTKAFTHRRFYTQTLLHADTFYTRTHAFTHKRFYTHTLSNTNAFTHRRCYTQTLVQKRKRPSQFFLSFWRPTSISCERVTIDQVKSQFFLSFWRPTSISCERVAIDTSKS